MCCANTPKDIFIKSHDGHQKSLKQCQCPVVSKIVPLSQDQVKHHVKVHKKAEFRRKMAFLLCNGSKCKDMIGGLVAKSETHLPSSPEKSTLNLIKKPQVKHYDVEVGRVMQEHDGPIVVWIQTIS
jgi:hypothetical protein